MRGSSKFCFLFYVIWYVLYFVWWYAGWAGIDEACTKWFSTFGLALLLLARGFSLSSLFSWLPVWRSGLSGLWLRYWAGRVRILCRCWSGRPHAARVAAVFFFVLSRGWLTLTVTLWTY